MAYKKRVAVFSRPAVARGIPLAVVEIFLDLGVDETDLTLDTTLEDLQLDELDLAELVMAFEDTFHLPPFPDRVLDTFPTATVACLLETLRTLGAKV